MTKNVLSNENVNKLVEDKALREELIGRVEVLDKVGNLLLLDGLDKGTTEMVADYYGIPEGTLKSVLHEHGDEIKSDGYTVCSKENLLGWNIQLKTKRGGFDIVDENGNVLASGNNTGIALFPKRAILRIGMLLRDSDVAKEIRTQLLNIVEVVKENNDEMLTHHIDKEKELYMKIMFAQTEVERAVAINEHMQYMERYKKQAERYEEVYHSDKLFTATEIAKDLGMSAQKLNAILNNLGVQFKRKGTWHLYSKHEHLVPSHCDYHITEYGQTMKWTNMGREWIIELLKLEGLLA